MSQTAVTRFFAHKATQLQGLVEATREIITHNLTKGLEAEGAVADLLASLLPKRYVAAKGFLIDHHGALSNEIDLIIFDETTVPRMFSFGGFELMPNEAASACVEVKTTLNAGELKDTFGRFRRIQAMEFVKDRVMCTTSAQGGQGLFLRETTRPEMYLFAFESSVGDDALRKVYAEHPELAHVKICVLSKGIYANLQQPREGLTWIRPVETSAGHLGGSVLSLFLFQFLLPELAVQVKSASCFKQYLTGESDFIAL